MICNKSIGSYGRFANGMFQIAACLGVARKNNQSAGFERWYNYDHRDRFGSNEDIDLSKYFVNKLPQINNDLNFYQINVNWGYGDLNLPDGNWDIRGHFQSEKWFTHCLDEVRFYFRMNNEKEHDNYIAIHWRAGDYEENQEAYHPRLSRDYYMQAIRYFGGERFLVFSDDIAGAKKMFGEKFEYSQGDYLSDFRRMKMCKSFICANSSFSLMAAILGEHPEKQIVCPQKWFGAAAGGLPTHDLYPSKTIIL